MALQWFVAIAWGCLQRAPVASMWAHVCSRVVGAPFLLKMQPFPERGLVHGLPKLYVIHSGSEDLVHALLILAFASLLAVAEDDGLVLRDEELEGLSLRDCSDRVLADC